MSANLPPVSTPSPQGRRRIWMIVGGLLLFMLFGVSAAFVLWYTTRPQPATIDHQELFPGLWYTRETRQTPIAQVIHIIEIDLSTPGLHFRVTPKDNRDDYIYSARTTSQFLDEENLALAINGDFFDPWRDYHLLDYYPHVGDGVNVRGYTVSEGQEVTKGYAPGPDTYASLFLTEENQASFETVDQPYNVISGNLMIVADGKPIEIPESSYVDDRHPRTAVALTEDGSRMLLVLIDGRQPNYSIGASLHELADIIIAYGGYTALNLDGGGSTALAVRGETGDPMVLNSPIHNRIPGRERPIANHLGVWFETP